MTGYRKMFVTLAIGGAVALFPMMTVSAEAGEQGGAAPAPETALQAKPADGQGEYEYAYRNAWSHRQVRQTRHGNMGEDAGFARGGGFVDENGDGINDLAPDHDGDGVPNGQDPDWVKNKRDGTGYKHGNQATDGSKRAERSQFQGSKKGQSAR
jgi:hypothetical protein